MTQILVTGYVGGVRLLEGAPGDRYHRDEVREIGKDVWICI
jgi:hypothetical protein